MSHIQPESKLSRIYLQNKDDENIELVGLSDLVFLLSILRTSYSNVLPIIQSMLSFVADFCWQFLKLVRKFGAAVNFLIRQGPTSAI